MIDVLDHMLGKGIVIEAGFRGPDTAIDLVTAEVRVVVVSVFVSAATHLKDRLRRVLDQLERGRFEPQPNRRAEDRLREDVRDERARTIAPD